jgi:hypothetical protein
LWRGQVQHIAMGSPSHLLAADNWEVVL